MTSAATAEVLAFMGSSALAQMLAVMDKEEAGRTLTSWPAELQAQALMSMTAMAA
eukprot:CAMPEP_0196595310 /NCGR_PEP_ID=MMETSP1081-20130531/80771_1 /TAXON_ID=36882 /ORGANISM="Pyramimonas amylifera, Strain CCMP720" /LENGTH=54 /DNA_ID=CAMNT_0041919839 /DNA_START=1 /DNA_END=162 /DNA_ORIENTATION=+